MKPFGTAAFDLLADPPRAGRMPHPFACAFHAADGTRLETWGDWCVVEMMDRIAELDARYLIYAHTAGRNDFHFLWDYVQEPVTIIGARLIEFSTGVTWRGAHHVWRDSFSILPLPLADIGTPRSIDPTFAEAINRDEHRTELLEYLHQNVSELLHAVAQFRRRFEPAQGRHHLPLTVGTLAIRELAARHAFERATASSDDFLRRWYFGGRNQCFAAGVIRGPWKCYDVNSAYAKAMRDALHPLTDEIEELKTPPHGSKAVWFAEIRARNRQALPWRDTGNHDKIEFNISESIFHACSHELVPAIEAGMVEVLEYLSIWRPIRQGRFDRFVDDWMTEKIAAEQRGDILARQFAKLVLNSATGKLGVDPRRFRTWALLRDPHDDAEMIADGWEAESVLRSDPEDWLELWSKPAPGRLHSFQNVAIAASITSAARSLMLDGLRCAVRPIYCDTDSVVCQDFTGRVDPLELGAWRHECTAEFAAIAGRKTYCLFDVDPNGKVIPVKYASKGEVLSPAEIIKIAKGGAVEKINAAPQFSVHGRQAFTRRFYRKTVDAHPSEF